MQNWIEFTAAPLPPIDQVGGKALALMQMTQAGMPVPPGFILTTDFFKPWLERLQATAQWAGLLRSDGEAVAQAARALQSLCAGLELTMEQQAGLAEALESFREKRQGSLFAVRSSSPEEDLEGASFAGGYTTTLGVTVSNLGLAVRLAFTSAFDEKVLLYKRNRGFQFDRSQIAVIVQEQVEAESAGVAFSLNPINNCFDEAVINANHGLGESVVSGVVEPDVFIVDRVKGKVLESRLGKKQTIVALDQNGGTRTLENRASGSAALAPGQVLELARLLGQVEAYFQRPVDIEWAFSAGKVYLLQARPITTYLPLPDEMITPPGKPKLLYANSTLIEQGMEKPLSVLGTDFLRYVLNQVGGPVARDAVGIEGAAFTAGGGYYINVSYMLKMGMGRAALSPGSFGDPRVMAILDNIDKEEYLAAELPKKLKTMRSQMLFGMAPLIKSTLLAYLRPEHTLQDYYRALPQIEGGFKSFLEEKLSLHEFADRLTGRLGYFYDKHGIPLIAAAQVPQQRIKSMFKREPAQIQDQLINLGISIPQNKTTDMGELMYTLASTEEVRRYGSADDFLAGLSAGELSPDFVKKWRYFLDEFGMRCPGEIDPATPRPREQQGLLFEQLKNLSETISDRSGSESFFEEARAKRERTFQFLYDHIAKKGNRKAKTFKVQYQKYLLLGGFRETPKHYVIKVIDLFRSRVLQIAQAFVAANRLDHPGQIFDLTIADIDLACADPSLDLRALAEKRSALIRKIEKSHHVARIIDSRGKIFFPPRLAGKEGEIPGVPISPGVVTGRARVLHSPYEKKLLPGEILVARATDPGWTPLFLNARGIILEIGGALQHGAVVAREYGIPCVSGLDDATHLISDGQLVEVDGSNGTIRILS